MVETPVSERASTREILAAREMSPFSNWKPSRGPTSLMMTWLGMSLMR
jgi:hypothetical protein